MTLHKPPCLPLRGAVLAAVLLGCCLATACTGAPPTLVARDGSLDLSQWDFKTHGAASLAGEWEFVWGRLVAPEQFPLSGSLPDYLQAPGLWHGDTARGKSLSAIGCGTYRLRVQLPPEIAEPLTLLTTGALSVCRIFVNGKPMAASGFPACKQSEEQPKSHFSVTSLPPATSLELVIQVSNHHNTQGGLGGRLLLGATTDIQGHLRFLWLSGALVGGALFCMSIYHFALFFLRRSFRANMYFGLFCLFWAMATVFSPSSGFLVDAMGLKLNWGLYVTLAILPYGLTTPLLLQFYQTLFPKKYGKVVTWGYMILGGLYIGYILATPANAYDPLLFFYFVLTRGAFLYLFAMFIVDAVRRKQGVLLLAPGYLGLAYAELDDVLFDLNIVASADFGLYGVLVFILAYSFFMSSRYASAYSRLEELSQARGVAGKQPSLAGIKNMLDSLEEAVIAVNQSGGICFCNKAFAALTGFACPQLMDRPLSDVLETSQGPASRALLEAVEGKGPPSGKARAFQDVRLAQQGQSIAVNLLLTGLDLAEEPLLLVLVRKPVEEESSPQQVEEQGQTAPVSDAMLRDLNANRQRILQLEEAVLSLDTEGKQESRALLDDLKALDELLRRLGTWLTASDKSGERRRQAVTVMRLALDCWAAAGHGSKVELAEQSRIWNVYLEKDGYFRTQTLDKYLSIKTLPSRPRWRDIHATARFVLASCDSDIPACQLLAKALAEFEDLS